MPVDRREVLVPSETVSVAPGVLAGLLLKDKEIPRMSFLGTVERGVTWREVTGDDGLTCTQSVCLMLRSRM